MLKEKLLVKWDLKGYPVANEKSRNAASYCRTKVPQSRSNTLKGLNSSLTGGHIASRKSGAYNCLCSLSKAGRGWSATTTFSNRAGAADN